MSAPANLRHLALCGCAGNVARQVRAMDALKGYPRLIDQGTRTDPQFPDNYVSTTHFTAFNFLPLAVFNQFRKLANVYFLMIAILCTTPISPFAPITAPRAAPRRAKPKKAQAMTFASSWFGRRRLMPREPATKRSHGMAPARPQAQAPLVARTAAPPNTFNPVVVPKEQSKSSHREEWNQESKGKMRKGRRRGGITVMIG